MNAPDDDKTRPVTAKEVLPTIGEITLERMIGRGGMGTVYLGHQPFLNRRVAVKILSVPPGGESSKIVERFKREAKMLAALSHPNIVACYQAGTMPDGNCYLAMEYIDGLNLREWARNNGPLRECDALDVTRSIAQALDYALARGIIHRDVKPENILLRRKENPPADDPFPFVAKLADLGLARTFETDADQSRLTMEGAIMGTPSTMSPEQFNDPDNVDFLSDVYGLGCALYEALTAERAFPQKKATEILMRKVSGDAPNPRRLRAELSPEIGDLTQWMLAPNKEDRPQSYAQLGQRCEELLVGSSSPTGRPVESQATQTAIPPSAVEPSPRSGITGRVPGTNTGMKWTIPLLIFGAGIGVVLFITTMKGQSSRRDADRRGEPVAHPSSNQSSPTTNQTETTRRVVSTGENVSELPSTVTTADGAFISKDPFKPIALPFEAEGSSLFDDKALDPLAAWEIKSGEAQWGREEEGNGAIGSGGKGRRGVALGSGPWRVEGVLGVVSDEAGIRVDLKDGGSLAVAVQNIGKGWLVSMVPFKDDPATGQPARLPPLADPSPWTMPEKDLQFSITAAHGEVEVQINGKPFGGVKLKGEISGISLYLNGRSCLFRSLTYHKPI